MNVIVIFVLLQKKPPRKRRWRMRHLGDPPPRATDINTSENTKWAKPCNEQYSRDAAIEDGIATKLEQLLSDAQFDVRSHVSRLTLRHELAVVGVKAALLAALSKRTNVRVITASTETQKGHNYLRCTKWTACSQPYVREEAITQQIVGILHKISLPADWANWMLAELEREQATDTTAAAEQLQSLRDELADYDRKLDRLMAAYLDEGLSLTGKTANSDNGFPRPAWLPIHFPMRHFWVRDDFSEKIALFRRVGGFR